SRPTKNPRGLTTLAAARPSARTSSGLSSVLATPLTPSVPNLRLKRLLPLRVLRCLAGLLEPVLLALLLAGVPGQESGPLELAPPVGVELGQSPGDAEAQGTGLARGAPSADGGVDVVGVPGRRQPEGLGRDHAMGGRREVLLDRAPVDGDGAVA